ncbi:MAG TPA: hypothetical protein VG963_28770, partial [Polyangiaceae bacterium]|nr:hypothetical protein [Polyangiaceae bacterium]
MPSARWARGGCTLACCAAWLLVACGATSPRPVAAPAAAAPPASTAVVPDAPAAAPPPPEARGAGECPRATRFEANAVAAEVGCLLARYLRIDTTNPPGHELAAAEFLKQVLARDGMEAEIIESAPGRANLFARLPGTATEQALLLVSHMDVVPANASEWTVPPFAGLEKDGVLW